MNISNDILVFIYTLYPSWHPCEFVALTVTLHYGYTKNEIPVIGHLF